MNIDKVLKRYLETDKPVDDFIEEITSSDLGDTPQKSPLPSEYDKDNPEGKVKKIKIDNDNED